MSVFRYYGYLKTSICLCFCIVLTAVYATYCCVSYTTVCVFCWWLCAWWFFVCLFWSFCNCKDLKCVQVPNCLVSTHVECQFGCRRSLRRERKPGIRHCFKVDRNAGLSVRTISLHTCKPARLCYRGLQQYYMAVAKQENKPESF